MRDPVKERASLAAKRDFDMLPRSVETDVQPARRSELSAIAEMGNRWLTPDRLSTFLSSRAAKAMRSITSCTYFGR